MTSCHVYNTQRPWMCLSDKSYCRGSWHPPLWFRHFPFSLDPKLVFFFYSIFLKSLLPAFHIKFFLVLYSLLKINACTVFLAPSSNPRVLILVFILGPDDICLKGIIFVVVVPRGHIGFLQHHSSWDNYDLNWPSKDFCFHFRTSIWGSLFFFKLGWYQQSSTCPK